MSAYEQDQDQDRTRATWEKRIRDCKAARRNREPVWLSNLAYASGKHHLEWSRTQRKLILPELAEGRERYTLDIIGQYRMAAIGELTADDGRPELLLIQDGQANEEYQQQVNRAVGYWWENEGDVDDRLADVKQWLIDLGTAATRSRFDPTLGPVKAEVPLRDGEPVYDDAQARAHVAQLAEQGETAEFKTIHEGRIVLEALTPWQLLVPPGVTRERDFPYEIVVVPRHLDKLVEEFGDVASELTADEDIGSIDGLEAGEAGDLRATDPEQDIAKGKLRDHAWLYTCYQRPNAEYPNGRTVVLAGREMRVLKVRDELPCKAPDGTPRSGITYFHWWRQSNSFWSRSLVDVIKDPQRMYNRLCQMEHEIIARGMPKVYMTEKSLASKPKGLPMEIIFVKKDEQAGLPQVDKGIGPGDYIYKSKQGILDDLAQATGMRPVSLGENPSGVNNYSQLAYLREQDQRKIDPIVEDFKRGQAQIVENAVYDMRRYWGEEKQLKIAGNENRLQAETFNASSIQDDGYKIAPVKGAAKPRSQAAELQKINDIGQFARDSGMPLPVEWYKESLDAGEAQELPERPADDQFKLALLENELLAAGEEPEPDYFDDALMHIPQHRSLQIQARMSGDQELYQRLETHIQKHILVEQIKAQFAPPPAAPAEVGAAPGPPLGPGPAPTPQA